MTFFQENVLEEAERGGAFFGLRPLFGLHGLLWLFVTPGLGG